MPQKSNHDFKEKCPYMHAGKSEPMRIKEILTKNITVRQRFRIRVRHIMT